MEHASRVACGPTANGNSHAESIPPGSACDDDGSPGEAPCRRLHALVTQSAVMAAPSSKGMVSNATTATIWGIMGGLSI